MKRKILSIALFSLITIPVAGYSVTDTSINNQQVVKLAKKPLYWVDPMEPDVHYKAPGKSRMGMELVPVYPKEKNSQ